jgi:hypothetical protein
MILMTDLEVTMYTVNPELFKLAQQKLFEKSAVVPGQAAMPADPAAMGAAPPAGPMDPSMAMMQGAPAGGDPAAAMGAMMPPDPMAAMAQPAPAPAAQPQAQKLKPEQMMQMLDYRLYNMQQQLTAIMNAMGVEVAPESLVLPPGTTGAPPAEAALPGGPMAPPPPSAAPEQAGGPMPPGGPLPPGGPMPPDAMPPDAGGPKMAAFSHDLAQRLGRPIAQTYAGNEPTAVQTKAGAIAALCRSLLNNDR